MSGGARRWVVLGAAGSSGAAALTWEILWQHHAALAFGVSAAGAAIALACIMGGMAVGSLVMGRVLEGRNVGEPLRLYGLLELGIGLWGLLLGPGFDLLTRLDTSVYGWWPSGAPLLQLLGVVAILGPPALAMGATIPVFALMAPSIGTSIASLYAANTAGAAVGILIGAFAWLPDLGVSVTGSLAALVNVAVALVTWLLPRASAAPASGLESRPERGGLPPFAALAVFTTGFVTFCLEVAWFRSLRAAFQSTSDSFALVLAAFLAPLAIGAWLASRLSDRPRVLGTAIGVAGCLCLLVTPLVERFDLLALWSGGYWGVVLGRMGLTMLILGPPVLAMGIAFPWILARARTPRETARLYGLNTIGAVAGALLTAWVLLPWLGASPASWIAGSLLVALAVLLGQGWLRRGIAAAGLASLALSIGAQSGVGRLRVQGAHLQDQHRVLASKEGPDATVSVVELADGTRELVIDGFQTSGEARSGHYMAWMGRLPMLLHPRPRFALVIGFGTGQTANAVRQEGPEVLDVAELSAAVLEMTDLFPSNAGVLWDRRVRTILVDGRAWLRRTSDGYDVVTLEPMAPHFAGTNSLYSREFYEITARRLRPGGIVAQWLPLHLLPPEDAASVTRTFVEVFPEALLWLDPVDRTGILLGRASRGEDGALLHWPGLGRAAPGRDLSPGAIRAGVRLHGEALGRYGKLGTVITDDNQWLAYGPGRRHAWRFGSSEAIHRANLDLLRRVAADAESTRRAP
jgi:spermidine synthase